MDRGETGPRHSKAAPSPERQTLPGNTMMLTNKAALQEAQNKSTADFMQIMDYIQDAKQKHINEKQFRISYRKKSSDRSKRIYQSSTLTELQNQTMSRLTQVNLMSNVKYPNRGHSSLNMSPGSAAFQRTPLRATSQLQSSTLNNSNIRPVSAYRSF